MVYNKQITPSNLKLFYLLTPSLSLEKIMEFIKNLYKLESLTPRGQMVIEAYIANIAISVIAILAILLTSGGLNIFIVNFAITITGFTLVLGYSAMFNLKRLAIGAKSTEIHRMPIGISQFALLLLFIIICLSGKVHEAYAYTTAILVLIYIFSMPYIIKIVTQNSYDAELKIRLTAELKTYLAEFQKLTHGENYRYEKLVNEALKSDKLEDIRTMHTCILSLLYEERRFLIHRKRAAA